MDVLEEKRVIKILPCNHEFHRTCAIHWLETRTNRRKQVCPLFRKITLDVSEERSPGRTFTSPSRIRSSPPVVSFFA
ncbi:hypothetical protein PENTCL1PPCAC_9813, partial [Pristionchus entomophagus]